MKCVAHPHVRGIRYFREWVDRARYCFEGFRGIPGDK